MSPATPILEVSALRVHFHTRDGVVQAVRGVDFQLGEKSTLAIVGESGCGKSVTMQAVMGLIPNPPGRVTAERVHLLGRSILQMSRRRADALRGASVGMIFQDPMSALDPIMKIGHQIAEPLRQHRRMGRRAAWKRAAELLEAVQVPDVAQRLKQYPFEFSGGMLQRAMIAMSLACDPPLLIADEPTTALDVTIQAQILDLLADLQQRRGMAVVLITHDLGVVARLADRVLVLYAGQVVESGTVERIFHAPAHPYTIGLRRAIPVAAPGEKQPPVPIDGTPPDLLRPPPGCAFFARCSEAMRLCERHGPHLLPVAPGHSARCWLHHPGAPK